MLQPEESLEIEEIDEVLPYQYEPMPDGSREEDPNFDLSNESLTESESETDYSGTETQESLEDEWCICGNCSHMTTEPERICCSTIPRVSKRLDAQIPCITQHEGFQGNCLNIYVLEEAFYEMLQREGPIGDEEAIHRIYRHLAYRKFIRWIYGRLGKGKRKPLPACAVLAIRKRFPSEHYAGFKYPR